MTPRVSSAWLSDVGVDAVLNGQGVPPRRVRERSPRLLAIAARATRDGASLLAPRVAVRALPIRERDADGVTLEGGFRLTGPLIAARLGAAERAAVLVATLGEALERRVSRMLGRDLSYAFALDGFGSAAIEALVRSATRDLEECVWPAGAALTRPVSPGMHGFDLSRGQREVFAILGGDAAGVRLLPGGGMSPRKSLTLVFGVGGGAQDHGHVCDPCPASAACRFRGLHASAV